MANDLGDRAQYFTVDASNTTVSVGTNAPSTIDNAIRAISGALARDFDYRGYKVTSAGTATALTVTYSAADPAALYDGQPISFVSHVAAGAAATLKNGALTLKNIKKHKGSALVNLEGGEFGVGQYVEVHYKTTPDAYVLTNPSQPVSYATNASNTCTRFPDGTQICFGTESVTSAVGVMTFDTVTFVSAFSTTTGMAVLVTANTSATTVDETAYINPTTTTVEVGVLRSTISATPLSFLVIGRWY